MIYHIDEPMDTFFDAVKHLVKVVELATIPFSAEKIVDIGYIIIAKNKLFRRGIYKWSYRPLVNQPWTNLKDTFTIYHEELWHINVTANELGYYYITYIMVQIVK